MSYIQVVAINLIICCTIYRVIELLVHRKERLKMVEKINEIQTGVQLGNVFGEPQSQLGSRPLRFGLLMLGCGAGFLMGLVVASQTDIAVRLGQMTGWDTYMFVNTIEASALLIFGGLGLLASYLIEARNSKK